MEEEMMNNEMTPAESNTPTPERRDRDWETIF